ncbi:putative redox-active protein [Methanophagales archaeon]|nr:putative redox-active protein [Methanophagales archaeon]
MTEKSEIDREVLDEAYRRGSDYLMRYACAPDVFAAVMDTLGYEDDLAVNDVWKAAVGFVGGTGNMAIGTCGVMAGAAMAISYSFGLKKGEPEDMMELLNVISEVAEVGKKMQEKYGHIQCQEVQFNLLNPIDSPIQRLCKNLCYGRRSYRHVLCASIQGAPSIKHAIQDRNVLMPEVFKHPEDVRRCRTWVCTTTTIHDYPILLAYSILAQYPSCILSTITLL